MVKKCVMAGFAVLQKHYTEELTLFFYPCPPPDSTIGLNFFFKGLGNC